MWLLFNKSDDSIEKGLVYFITKKTNIINLAKHIVTTWKPTFSGSNMLLWEVDEEHNKPINIFIIGYFDAAELVTPITGLFNPAY
jgi:hypothetical protein